jgi:hypothetical protein
MSYENALKDFGPVAHLTYFEYGQHTTIEDLCYLCLHELDLHAEGEYWHPVKTRQALLRFCKKWGPLAQGGIDYVAESKQQFELGKGKRKEDCLSV